MPMTQLDDKIDNLVLEHGFGVYISDEKWYIVPLYNSIWGDEFRQLISLTCTGFRRSTIKLSALCIMNRVNLWQRIRSISSACFILILNRMELIEGSMRTRSFSFREMVSGLSSTSLEPLKWQMRLPIDKWTMSAYAASTSGLLWRSTTWVWNEYNSLLIGHHIPETRSSRE